MTHVSSVIIFFAFFDNMNVLCLPFIQAFFIVLHYTACYERLTRRLATGITQVW